MDSGVTSSSGVAGNGVVKLNVGGTPFTTTLTVLTSEPDSMLGAMFSGRHATKGALLEDGSIFIDRPARMFHHVLAWLHDRTVPKQLSEEERELLFIEAEYYCIQGLVCVLHPELPHFTRPLGDIRCLREFKGHAGTVRSIVSFASPGNGAMLASAGNDKTVKVWNASTWDLLRMLPVHITTVSSLRVFTNAENRVCLASADCDNIKIWDPFDGSLLRTLVDYTCITNRVRSLAVFSNAKNQVCLASGSRDGSIKLWNPATGNLHRTLTGHTGWVFSLVAFVSPEDRPCLASGCSDETVKVWDPSTGGLLRTLSGHTDFVWDLVVFTLAKGQLCLASASSDSTIKIWNPATGDLLHTLLGHAKHVYSLAVFTDVGNQVCLASGGAQAGGIKMWNASTGDVLNTLHTDTTTHCLTAFTDSQGVAHLASATDDGKIKLWG